MADKEAVVVKEWEFYKEHNETDNDEDLFTEDEILRDEPGLSAELRASTPYYQLREGSIARNKTLVERRKYCTNRKECRQLDRLHEELNGVIIERTSIFSEFIRTKIEPSLLSLAAPLDVDDMSDYLQKLQKLSPLQLDCYIWCVLPEYQRLHIFEWPTYPVHSNRAERSKLRLHWLSRVIHSELIGDD